ncbi:ABC transporter ATP-binding protein [Candidatus Woesearchaeota archaeon]|nr:MAG: ABC transporter ATP-binding protein [Candidatus Woesearchaeota archaeon]
MDELLLERIHFTAKAGLSRKQVVKLLLSAGWPEKLVKRYVQKAFKEVAKGDALQVRNVGKSFGANTVLEGVDFDVRSGEIFGLIGMSGAGKTTLLNILVGALSPDSGDVLVAMPDGSSASVRKEPVKARRMFGFSTQSPSFYDRLTVRENLEHFARLYGLQKEDARRRALAVMDLVGLGSARDIEASKLSGGMQKRLDIACALIHDPSILVLDEPTADLDPIMRKNLWQLMRDINVKGTTIILASHFLAEIELLCSRIAILNSSRIVDIGSAKDLRNVYARNFNLYVQTFSQDYSRLLRALGKDARIEGGELVLNTSKPKRALSIIAKVLLEGDVASVNLSRPSLGEVFEKVVGR